MSCDKNNPRAIKLRMTKEILTNSTRDYPYRCNSTKYFTYRNLIIMTILTLGVNDDER